jgi:hypothetical protein
MMKASPNRERKGQEVFFSIVDPRTAALLAYYKHLVPTCSTQAVERIFWKLRRFALERLDFLQIQSDGCV